MRILGIDPGSRAMGFGIVDSQGSRLVAHCWGRITAPQRMPLAERLLKFFEKLQTVLAEEKPTVAAVENIFFAQHARSALILGQARGVALLAVAQAGIPVVEYSPLSVKQAVIGYGRGEKAQVQAMVKTLLRLEKKPPSDAADSLDVEMCHANSSDMQATLQRAQTKS